MQSICYPGKNSIMIWLMSSGICLWLTLKFHQIWVAGLIWSEIKQLWDVGLKEYDTNILYFFLLTFYTFVTFSYIKVRERYVERRGLHHQLPLRRDNRTSIARIL